MPYDRLALLLCSMEGYLLHRPHGSKEKPESSGKKDQMFLPQWLNMQWFSPNKLNLLLGEGTLGFKRFMKLMYFEYHQ